MSESTLGIERIGGVALLTIKRPKVLNAIDWDTHMAFKEAWRSLGNDASVRAVVITGEGPKAFCVGAEIQSFLPRLASNLADGSDTGDFCGVTRDAPVAVPIIAAINGLALGGGLEMALACDIRIASNKAALGLPEVNWSVIAGAGGVTRLARLVPAAVAADMIASGQPIPADRAHQVGLVSRISEPEALMADAMALADRIARNGPEAVRQSIRLTRGAQDEALVPAMLDERRALKRVMETQDFRTGIAAFQERRDPVYEDR